MKITVKTNQVIEKEIDLESPLYLKHKNLDSYAYFKDEKTKGLIVWANDNIASSNTIANFGLFNEFIPSTPEEFNAALEAAINHIQNLNK